MQRSQHINATGLSATIFADNLTGETFLAIRGTEITDPSDLFAGLSLATFGTTVLPPQYASLKTQVQAWLSDGTLPQTFTVTGHSLGGFLAMGLANDPVFAANVSHAYLYNAPGMGGIAGSFADMLLGFMGLSPTGDSTRISNIEDQTQISGSPSPKNHSQQTFDTFGNARQNLSQNYSSARRLAA